MDKFCIFCGGEPVAKNKEHVLPQWLIELTGNPKRLAGFGIDLFSSKQRKYSLNQFQFPACKDCNNEFSSLEGKAKTVITNLLDEKPISAKGFSTFLTWLDKVRIGLWLGLLYLDKNIYGIEPNFFIKDRLNKKDRMVFVYNTNETRKRLNIIAVNTAFFAHYPSCFGLRINQFMFINASSDFLLARRLGLPFPPFKAQATTRHFGTRLSQGLERVLYPIIRFEYNTKCTEIYQPIIPDVVQEGHNHLYYKTEYSKNFFSSSRLGNIFIKTHDKTLMKHSTRKSSLWIPNVIPSLINAEYYYTKAIFQLQKFLLKDMPIFNELPNELRNNYKRSYRNIERLLNKYLEKIDDEMKPKTKF